MKKIYVKCDDDSLAILKVPNKYVKKVKKKMTSHNFYKSIYIGPFIINKIGKECSINGKYYDEGYSTLDYFLIGNYDFDEFVFSFKIEHINDKLILEEKKFGNLYIYTQKINDYDSYILYCGDTNGYVFNNLFLKGKRSRCYNMLKVGDIFNPNHYKN